MMLRMWSCALFGFFMTGFGFAQNHELQHEIDKLMHYEHPGLLDRVPGMIIAAWDSDAQWIMQWGDIDTSHFFELGSATKPVTATIASFLLEELNLDPSVSFCSLLPPDVCHQAWQDCSVEDILQHRAGLPRTGMLTGRDTALTIDERMLHMLAQLSIPRAGRYAYSQTGYAALYWFLAKKEWQTEIDSILNRYSMRKSLQKNEVIAPGFGHHLLPVNPLPEDCMVWATGLKARCSGLLRFVKDQANGITIHHNLSARDMRDAVRLASRHGEYVVHHGWFVLEEKKHLIWYHNGRTNGHAVSMAFEPFHNRGCIVISNTGAGTQSLSLDILRMLRRARN